MSELLFSRIQSYAWVLYFAKWLLEEEKNHPVGKIDHQMNTRIYNNSFCGLLKNGYPYAEIIQNGISFLNLDIDGATYQCPTNTAANILRMDFAEAAAGALGPVASEKRGPYQNYLAVQEEPNNEIMEVRTGESFSEQKEDFKEYKEKQYEIEIHEDFTIPANNEKSLPISVTLDDIIFMPPTPKEVLEITASMTTIEKFKKLGPAATGKETLSEGATGISDSNMEQPTSKGYGRFKPKNLPDPQETQVQLLKAEQNFPINKPKRSLFFHGSRKKEDETVQALKVQDGTSKREGEPHPSCIAKMPQTGGGKLFQHIHIVMLKKQFGAGVLGPYRFIFWPVQIPEMKNGKMWADFIVHITEPDGEETVACTGETYKELMITLDGKEFNIFSTWDSGIFGSHVTLRSKTASIYAISEEIHREEPSESVDDFYLEQFRHERKGQPKHFVVPFSSYGDEENVPIIGYVEVEQKKYPLVRREGNILRYKYAGTEKVIKGFWKDGAFKYFVEDDSRF